jgi:hypothetical protein
MNKENQQSSEDISLKDLRLFLYNILVVIESTTKFFWNVLKKRWLTLIVLALIGSGIGYGVHSLSKNTFYAQMTISYYELHNKIYGDMIAKLNSLVKNKNYDKVASLLDLTLEQCEKLKKIEAFNVRNEPLFEDLSYKKSPILISIKLKDEAIANDIQKAIITYLESNRFISSRKEMQTRNLKQELGYVKEKIRVIDDLLSKPDLLNVKSQGDDDVSTVADLLEKSKEMFQRKLDIESTLEIDKKIEVIDNAVVIQHPIYGNVLKMILIGAITLIAIGGLIICASEYKKIAEEEFKTH